MNRKQKNEILLWTTVLVVSVFGLGVATGILIGATASKPKSVAQESQTIIHENEIVMSEKVEEFEIEEPDLIETEKPEIATENLGEFKLTAYCTCAKCCGKWADGITATGTKATPDRTIAVDPDVIPLGSKVYINDREYIAEDTGGAIQNNRIDIFFPSHQEALNFGVQYADVAILKN